MAIAISCIIVFAYYWITGSQRTGDWFRRRFTAREAQIRKVLFNRLLGALLFSSAPLVILLGGFGQETSDLGLGTDNLGRSLLFWLPAAILIPIIASENPAAAVSHKAVVPVPNCLVNDIKFCAIIVFSFCYTIKRLPLLLQNQDQQLQLHPHFHLNKLPY